jgi:hypothetical protein
VFCAACGCNLASVERLPTRGEWERGRSVPDGDAGTAGASSGETIAAFLAAMHAAGDPGAAKTPMAKPGSFGRTRHAEGWVVRPVERHRDEPARYEPGVFLTTDGRFHRLESTARGWGQRNALTFSETVGPELAAVPAGDRLTGELEALLRDNGIRGPAGPARR